MAVNKVIYGNNTLLDLTSDTITEDKLISGITAHDKAGNGITGTLQIQRYYTGASVPSSSLGNDGDIYLMS